MSRCIYSPRTQRVFNKCKPAGFSSLPWELQECDLLVRAVWFGINKVMCKTQLPSAAYACALVGAAVRFSGSPLPPLQLVLGAHTNMQRPWKWQSSNIRRWTSDLRAHPHLYGVLCVVAYSSRRCSYEKRLHFHLQQVVTGCLISTKHLKGCFKQTLKELVAQDCADICSTRLPHVQTSSNRLVSAEEELLTYGVGSRS